LHPLVKIAGGIVVITDPTRGERLQIMLTKEELDALDSWRFARRMPSRAAAIRELLKRGLVAEGFTLVEGGSQSRDFGVIGQSSDSPTRDRQERIVQDGPDGEEE
jgi:hypothetical protein